MLDILPFPAPEEEPDQPDFSQPGELEFYHPLIEQLENQDHNLGLAEWTNLLLDLASQEYADPPLPTFPRLVTLDTDYVPEDVDDPAPYLEVMEVRVLLGFQPKHPLDVIVEELDGFGRLAHHLGNGEDTYGRLVVLPFRKLGKTGTES